MEKLKARIDDMYPTRAAFAEAIGVDPSKLCRMLQNGNWRAEDIQRAVKALRIPARDIPAYFFSNTVAFNAPKETV